MERSGADVTKYVYISATFSRWICCVSNTRVTLNQSLNNHSIYWRGFWRILEARNGERRVDQKRVESCQSRQHILLQFTHSSQWRHDCVFFLEIQSFYLNLSQLLFACLCHLADQQNTFQKSARKMSHFLLVKNIWIEFIYETSQKNRKHFTTVKNIQNKMFWLSVCS